MMPVLGAPELIIILVIIILIFGVGKLPEVGQALGKGIREFRGAADDVEDETPPAAPARPAAPAAVDAPRSAPAVDVPRQTVTAPAAPVAATTPAAPATPAAVAYTVVAGDTPETVAKSHGVTVEELLTVNGWSRADRVLYEGDKVQVPAKNTVA